MLRINTRNLDAKVLAIILYNDEITITQSGRGTLWPIYMTLANIPSHLRSQQCHCSFKVSYMMCRVFIKSILNFFNC